MGWGWTVRAVTLATALTAALSGCDSLPWHQADPTPAAVAAADQSASTADPGPAEATPNAGIASPAPIPSGDDLWRHIGIELRLAAVREFASDDPLARFGASSANIEGAAARARHSLAHIVAELSRRGLPLEIALIPIIESSYDPFATSPAGAAGIWQLMPATARRFGLSPNRWYDPRRDIVASTQAALDYFELLRDRFMGDWPLVFAAYNCGEHTVERAIARNAAKGAATRFEALELPRATQEYVPRLFALAQIISDPDSHGVTLPAIANQPYFSVVDVGPSLPLERVRDWSGLDARTFAQLNAGYRLPLTSAGGPTQVLVPPERREQVIAAAAAIPPTERRPLVIHKVEPGDTLSHIALSSGVPVATLKRVNRLAGNHLAVGQVLHIPAPGSKAFAELAPARGASQTHRVRSGDNLWDIARRYGSSVAAIAAANGIDRRAVLALDQELLIPANAEYPPAVTTDPNVPSRYEVRAGDSLWAIARRFRVSVADLKRWNALGDDHRLMPGDELRIAPRITPADQHHDS